MDTNILLESGTNEIEVLEFTLGNNHYGINVAKIKEILSYQPITPVPNAHPCVEGILLFMLIPLLESTEYHGQILLHLMPLLIQRKPEYPPVLSR